MDLAGDDGQRSVLVLSDGADTGKVTGLADVTSAIESTATLVDVVSLDQENKPKATAALSDLAAAGQGAVIESTGDALGEAFAAEAEVLADQILVTAPLPDGFDAEEATVTITLPTPGRRPRRQRVREDPGRPRRRRRPVEPSRSTRTTASRSRSGRCTPASSCSASGWSQRPCCWCPPRRSR